MSTWLDGLPGEQKNPLMAGKVIGPISDPSVYTSDNAKRGEPDFVMGRSSLMEFNRCPLRWVRGYESEESKFTEWGSLIDCLFLTPQDFKNRYAVSPEVYPSKGMKCPSCGSVTDAATCRKCKTNRVEVIVDKPWDKGSTYCSEWEAQQAPKTIVRNKFFQPACDAVRILNDDPEIKGIKEASQSQVMATASYNDKETGIVVPLKILIDLCPSVGSTWGKSLCDLKTTTSAAMRPWVKTVFDHHLDCQAALYIDVWTANTGEDRVEFRHIVQESFHPYHTEKRMLSTEFLEIGRMRYLNALAKYCQCLKTGIWPGYEARRDFDGWQCVEPEPYMVQ